MGRRERPGPARPSPTLRIEVPLKTRIAGRVPGTEERQPRLPEPQLRPSTPSAPHASAPGVAPRRPQQSPRRVTLEEPPDENHQEEAERYPQREGLWTEKIVSPHRVTRTFHVRGLGHCCIEASGTAPVPLLRHTT